MNTKNNTQNRRFLFILGIFALLALFTAGSALAQEAGPTATPVVNAPVETVTTELTLGKAETSFTYQGYLLDGGLPANGSFDFRFTLYDIISDTAPVSGTLVVEDAPVSGGYFTVQLDFGDFPGGEALWLETAARRGESEGEYAPLGPRQALTTALYADYASLAGSAAWGGLTGVPLDIADGDDDTIYTAGEGLTLKESEISLAEAYRLPQDCALGYIPKWDGRDWLCAADETGEARTAVLLADHNHWGESWSGSGTGLVLSGGDVGVWGSGAVHGVAGESNVDFGNGVYGIARGGRGNGVYGLMTGDDGSGVLGVATASIGAAYGVSGQSDSRNGRGVYGWANAPTGETYGVYGLSNSSTDGRGVYGWANAPTGETYGVYGLSNSNNGRGVYGYTTATSGTTYGVYGRSDSTAGRGVYGYTTATSGTTYGVYGLSTSTAGRGVYGWNSRSVGVTYGVYGQSASTAGRGVYGHATATNGATYGVYGRSDSSLGRAGYFYNSSGGIEGGVALVAESRTGSGDVFRVYGQFASDIEFRVTGNGNVFADGTYTSPAADFAEMLPAAKGLQPGDVLVVGPDGSLALSSLPYQSSVVGVYSTQPGFLGGSGDDNAGKVPLAVVGVVPVKVSAENGPIQPGDLLTASATPGRAMRCEGFELCFGRTIGKALEGLDSGEGVILVLVMLQ